MEDRRGVAILVGAGDAIGAAVARRFAEGGYTICICRREAAKSRGLVEELKAAGHGERFTSADILLTTCLDWAIKYGVGICDNAHPYLERIHQRPAYQSSTAANVPLAPIVPTTPKAGAS